MDRSMQLPRRGDLFAGRYEIFDLLGVGGMGSVHLAGDRQTGGQVALKVMGERAVREPAMLVRFRREIDTLRRIDHPDILRYLDHGLHDGAPFLVFDLITGKSLAEAAPEFLARAESVLMLGARLARAFGAAHAKGVVHRDIKPENIKFTEAGEPRILDYGLARWIAPDGVGAEQAPTIENVTATNVVMGTIPYMSPEQLRGRRVDHRTDVFSLAVVLFELAGGRRPYLGSTADELRDAIEAADPPRLEALVPAGATPALSALDAVLRRALLPQPGARFQTMEELARALEQGRLAGSALPRDASFAILLPPTVIDAAYEQGAFFGRDREIAELKEHLRRARAGDGRLVVLEGASGFGRSRLTGEIAREAHREGFLCLTARAHGEDGQEPGSLPGLGAASATPQAAPIGRAYGPRVSVSGSEIDLETAGLHSSIDEMRSRHHPEIEWLRRAQEIFPADGAVLRARAACDGSIVGGQPVTDAAGADVRPGLDPSAEGTLPGGEAVARNVAAHTALRGALASLAERMPVLLVAEDLDEADAPTLLRLMTLRAFVKGRQILLLTTLRTDRVRGDSFEKALEQAFGDGDDPPAVRLSVGPLPSTDLSSIAEDLYPGIDLPDPLREQLWQRCGGSPAHARDILHKLEENGVLRRSVTDWTLEDPGDLPFPEAASARFDSRTVGIESEALALLETAAVVGATFTAEDLCEVLPTEGVAASMADSTAEQLSRLSRRTRIVLFEAGAWRFEPPIARAALLERLTPGRRSRLEESAARAAVAKLARADADQTTVCAAAARHFLEAGLDAEALPHAVRAARGLREAGAAKDALAWFHRARAVVEQHIETPDANVRDSLRVQLAEIELALGECCRMLSSNDDALAHFERARSLAAAAGREDLQARSLNSEARIYVVRGDVLQAQRRGRDAERLARRADLADQRALALSAQAHALSRAGETNEAEDMWTEAARILEGLGQMEETAEIEFRLGNHHLRLDRLDLAGEFYGRAAGRLEAQKSPLLVASLQNARAAAHILRRRPALALPMLEEAIAIFKASGARREEARSLHNIAECHFILGDLPAARRIYEQVLADRTEIGEVSLRAGDLRNLGQILFDLGEIEPALAHASEALGIKRQIEDRGYIPHCLTLLGEIELELGRTERARSAFLEVLSDFPKTRVEVVRALSGLGMVEWMAGQIEEAKSRFQDLLERIEGSDEDPMGNLAERFRLLRFFHEHGASPVRLTEMAPPALDAADIDQIPEAVLYRDLIAAQLAEHIVEKRGRLASALTIAERLGLPERSWRIHADLALLAPKASLERTERQTAAARIIDRQASRFRTPELRRAYLAHRSRSEALRLARDSALPESH